MAAHVYADLSFSVEGIPGRVSADGGVITVHVSDPRRAWRAAAGPVPAARAGLSAAPASGRGRGRRPRAARQGAALAERVALAGATVQLRGPTGVLVTLGAGVDSRVGALLAGSRRIRPGHPRAVAPLAAAQARASAGAHPRAMGAATGAGLLCALGWALRRRRH